MKDATVTVLHSRSPDAQQICATADIVVAAVGKPEVVKGDWVKEGAAVIDVGTNAVDVRILLSLGSLLPAEHARNALDADSLCCLGALKVVLPSGATAICFINDAEISDD